MRQERYGQRVDKLFTIQTFALCVCGLLLNLILSNIVIFLGLPLYIDNVGSVIVAALGGAIPGMTVGFLSNLINSTADPISMYYAILTIFNALVAAWMSRKGYLRKISGCIVLACMMMLIGGACGSVMTWLLYGGGIGGIAAPFANAFYANGMPEFWAQFVADMCVDIPDKLLTVLPVYLFLHFYPKKLYNLFPNSFIYEQDYEQTVRMEDGKAHSGKWTSVNVRITALIVISSIFVSGIAVVVAIRYYQEELKREYEAYVTSAATLISRTVDGDQVEGFLAQGSGARGYVQTKNQLIQIQESLTDLEYVYVYCIDEEGCHVVFDLDTEMLPGDAPGAVLPFDGSMTEYRDDLFAGGEVHGVVVYDEYGWLMTSLVPIVDAGGTVVAHAGADVSMERYIYDMLAFIIRMLSMLFGFSLFVSSIALWYARMRFTSPINELVDQTRKFNEVPPEKWLESDAWKNRSIIHTHDEIEELCETVYNTQKNISENVIKLQQIDKESAMKSEFYSRMSHDMRTPMNGIMGLVNLSEDETDLLVLKENIEKIGVSGNYLLALINDTLDMNKIESQKMKLEYKPVCVRTVYNSVRNMTMETLRDKGITYVRKIDVASPDVYLNLDEVRVKQIFMNLFSNAVKFTPRGGQVTFTVRSEEGPERNRYHVEVQDTGCGMSEDFIQNRLFHPFEQEKNNITISAAGSGLGLSIVKNLVEMMNGTIQVESKLGEGTTFIIDIAFDVVSPPEEVSIQEIDDTALQGKKVLLCEDHPLNAEIVKRLLAKKGMVVEHAHNGQEGVERFMKSAPQEYLAILMDVRMPVLDGLEATRAIRGLDREDAREIPIIAMTANAYAEDRRMTGAAGMNKHLSKPIDPNELYQTLLEYV